MAEQKPVDRWLSAIKSYPMDGWDGAAMAIAAHDQRVVDLERELDASDPGWHGRLDAPPRRRSSAPSAA